MQSAQGKAKGRVVFPHLNSPLPSQKIPLSPPRAFLGANPRFGEHFPDLGAETRGSRGARAGWDAQHRPGAEQPLQGPWGSSEENIRMPIALYQLIHFAGLMPFWFSLLKATKLLTPPHTHDNYSRLFFFRSK